MRRNLVLLLVVGCRRSVAATVVAAPLVAVFAAPASAQDPAARPDSLSSGKPSVFIDCRHCDLDFLRNEITWIDHVRHRAVADVHVLVTQQTTAAGGAATLTVTAPPASS